MNKEVNKAISENDLSNNQTEAMNEIIAQLKGNISDLLEEQEQLIEFEKMNALNSLVSGIAHEMNTPIGISITAASFIESKVTEAQSLIGTHLKDQLSLTKALILIKRSNNIVQKNLRNTANLVHSFKMTSVYNDYDHLVEINFSKYIRELINYLKHHYETEKKYHSIVMNMNQDIFIKSYPEAIQRIITNLVSNSIIHGFKTTQNGLIEIDIAEDPYFCILTYRDNGKGMDANTRKRIYEPFFTTNMGKECNGLGMNIVYNLVVHKMKGQIDCNSTPGTGLEIVIKLNKKGGLI